MFGFLGAAVAPLVDTMAAAGARLFRRLALFLVAAVCLLVVVTALTVAFALWIATLAGPIGAALAVAGLYLVVAVVAVVLATRGGAPEVAVAAEVPPAAVDPDAAGALARRAALNAQIDAVIAPMLSLLQRFGLRREQLAVLAGAAMAKRLGPVPLVGCAIVVGFLVGRLWKSWRHAFEGVFALSPVIADLLARRGSNASAEPPVA